MTKLLLKQSCPKTTETLKLTCIAMIAKADLSYHFIYSELNARSVARITLQGTKETYSMKKKLQMKLQKIKLKRLSKFRIWTKNLL